MYLRGKVHYPSQSLTSGTTYNVFQCVAPTNQRITVEGFGWYGAANAAQTPGVLSFNRASVAGTGGTSATPASIDEDDAETFQSTWKINVSSPTLGLEIDERMVNPQIGLSEYFPGQLSYMLKGGGILVVQFTPQWTGSYNGWILFGE